MPFPINFGNMFVSISLDILDIKAEENLDNVVHDHLAHSITSRT